MLPHILRSAFLIARRALIRSSVVVGAEETAKLKLRTDDSYVPVNDKLPDEDIAFLVMAYGLAKFLEITQSGKIPQSINMTEAFLELAEDTIDSDLFQASSHDALARSSAFIRGFAATYEVSDRYFDDVFISAAALQRSPRKSYGGFKIDGIFLGLKDHWSNVAEKLISLSYPPASVRSVVEALSTQGPSAALALKDVVGSPSFAETWIQILADVAQSHSRRIMEGPLSKFRMTNFAMAPMTINPDSLTRFMPPTNVRTVTSALKREMGDLMTKSYQRRIGTGRTPTKDGEPIDQNDPHILLAAREVRKYNRRRNNRTLEYSSDRLLMNELLTKASSGNLDS